MDKFNPNHPVVTALDDHTMKIYELKRGDCFTVPELPKLPSLIFDHMDGMYCYAETEDGQIVNINGGVECVVITKEK